MGGLSERDRELVERLVEVSEAAEKMLRLLRNRLAVAGWNGTKSMIDVADALAEALAAYRASLPESEGGTENV